MESRTPTAPSRSSERNIPDFCLVLMIGPSASGKSTVARRLFESTEILSSDHYRAIASNDTQDQSATPDAFELLHHAARIRLRRRLLTVIDATNLDPTHRAALAQIARDHDCPTIAVNLEISLAECLRRNEARQTGSIPPQAIRRQAQSSRQAARQLKRERHRTVFTLTEPSHCDQLNLVRSPGRFDRRDLAGPFDFIGDVHGCHEELRTLLFRLGYSQADVPVHPEGRIAVFVGDLVDRGPGSLEVLQTVIGMVKAQSALAVKGNHDDKFMRYLRGRDVTINHGLERTISQTAHLDAAERKAIADFINELPVHYMLDQGRVAVAHAGITPEYQNRNSGRITQFCMYGPTNAGSDADTDPDRVDWTRDYRHTVKVIYGHTANAFAAWSNNTVNLDTGCVYGGALTALSYPEDVFTTVPALRQHYPNSRPLEPPPGHRIEAPRPLESRDVTGRLTVHTETLGEVHVDPEHAAAALEHVSRFAVDPRWLVYVPPTVSPTRTSSRPDLLEHTDDAVEYYLENRISEIILQEKHMGSRGVLIVARDEHSVADAFHLQPASAGAAYTRTGRPFFRSPSLETSVLDRSRQAIETAGLWEQLETDFLVLDCEIMPWSLKGQDLITSIYAPTGHAANTTLALAHERLQQALARGIDTSQLIQSVTERRSEVDLFREAYARYCRPVHHVRDVSIAPFQLLASRGQNLARRDHRWHMATADAIAHSAPDLFRPTRHLVLRTDQPDAKDQAEQFFFELTASGLEGLVIKPLPEPEPNPEAPTQPRSSRQVQPALKVRGPSYLTIIYGPEYHLPNNLKRLRSRSLAAKRSMALRQHALGMESLDRFAAGEPTYRVHQAAYASLALATETTDPRL